MPAHVDEIEKTLADQILSAAARIREADQEADRWMELGNIYFAHGLYELAMQCYDSAELLGAPNARFYYMRGYARLQAGLFDEALADLNQVIARDPGYLPAYWRSGLLLLEQGKLDLAEQRFRQATAVDQTEEQSWVGLARVHLARGESAEAINLLEPLLETQPKHAGYINHLLGAAYRQVGRTDDARKAMNASGGGLEMTDPWVYEMGRYRSGGFGTRLRHAEQMIGEGEFDRAIQVLLQLNKEDPEHAKVLATLGAVYLMNSQYDDSIDYSMRALELKPRYDFAHENIALAYHIKSLDESPRSDEYNALAAEHIEQALEINPSLTSSLFIKGKVLAREGRYDEAISAYRKAYHLGGRSKSRFYRRTKDGLVPQTSVDWLYEAGKLEWRLERWEDSIRTLVEVIEHWPDSAPAHYYLGVAYMKTGQLALAKSSFASADRLSPGSKVLAEALRELQALEQEQQQGSK